MYISLHVMATSQGMSVCWFSAAQVCICIDTVCVCVCVLVMVSRSTGMCFTVLVMVSHSMCVLAVFTVCVYWLCPPTARVCTGSFAVRVCTGHGLP